MNARMNIFNFRMNEKMTGGMIDEYMNSNMNI